MRRPSLPKGVDHVAIDQAAHAEGLVPVPMHALDNAESIACILRDSAASSPTISARRAPVYGPWRLR